MICYHCQASNPDDALRCKRCGIAFSVVDDTETLGPTGQPAAPSQAPATSKPSVAAQVLTPPPESVSRGAPSTGGWASAAGFGQALEPGTEFGERYRIEAQLGEGGMGAVYKAYDKELDRVVAIKLLRAGLMADPSALQRFKQELLLASKISHKNVLRIHDLGDIGGVKFITMAYVEGEDLHGVLKKQGRLSIERTLHMTRQLCGALEAAHAEGVVHRDLKPQNILVDAADNAYVSDFGLAKSLEAGAAGMTRAGEFLGTPRYMSPEQVEGGKLDHRSDLYSLGLILYEMATGDVPFTGDSTLQLMYQRVKDKPKNPKLVNPDLPDYLARIILRCLEKDANDRYQHARDILADLDAQRATSGGRSIRVTLPVPVGRNWLAFGGLVALVVVVVLAIPPLRTFLFSRGGAPRYTTGQARHVTLLVADFQNTTGDPVFDGTLEPAFSIAVEGAAFISVFNRAEARKQGAQLQPRATAFDESVARLVAVREGINVVVLGAIETQAPGYHLQVRALDAVTGEEIVRHATNADKKGVLTAVGKLAAKVRSGLGDATPESAQLAAAETFTSRSLEAAQQYARAQEFQWVGKWDDAIEHYQRAAQLDPDLGRAYAGLAAVYSNMGRLSEAEKHYKLAFSKIDRMSDREKYRTRAGYYLVFRNTEKAIEELTELVRKYPADTAGRANLALAHFYRRDLAKALDEGRRAVELNPKNVPQRNNLGFYAMYAGDFETAIREQRSVLEMNASFVPAYVGIALSQLARGETSEAIKTYQRMEALGGWGASVAAIGLADVSLYEGRAGDAIAILEKAIREDLKAGDADAAATKRIALAEAYSLAGQSARALATLDEATASRRESILFWAARTYLALGRDAKALALARELGQRLQAEPQAYAKLIEGEVLLKRRKPQEALRAFLESRKLADTWLGRQDAGRAYLEAGAFAEASSELEACLKRRGEATAVFLDEVPTYRVLPPVYYALGRAQEGLGSPGAAESYKMFLALKKDGAQDPMVADARRRLERR